MQSSTQARNHAYGMNWPQALNWICNILICRCMQKYIQHNKDERTQFFRKIYLSLYSKGFERVTKNIICERWVGDRTELQHIDPPHNSSGYNSISFSFSWAVQPGAWGPSLCWYMVLFPASSLQLTDFLSHPRYIIIWHPPTSSGVTIRTQFNQSAVKVIPRYLRPDAPVIYTGAFLIWQLSWVGGQYVTIWRHSW